MRVLLVALLFTLIPFAVAMPHPLTAGLADQGEISWSNPAMQPQAPNAMHLPLGLAALAVLPDRSPVYAFWADDYSRIDLAKTVHQLRYPSVAIINPPDGPRVVMVRLSAERIEVSTPEGGAIPVVSGAGVPRSGPLYRPRLIPLFGFGSSRVELTVGIATAAGMPAFFLDEASRDAFSAGLFEPNSTYEIAAEVSADLSIAARTRLVVERSTGSGAVVRAAIGIYTPVSVAHAKAESTVAVETDEQTLPSRVDYDYSLTGWTPGRGVGVGLRVDTGIAIEAAPWTVGFGLGSLVRLFAGFGYNLLDPQVRTTVSYPWQAPVPVVTLRYRGPFAVGRALDVLFGAGWDGGALAALVGITNEHATEPVPSARMEVVLAPEHAENIYVDGSVVVAAVLDEIAAGETGRLAVDAEIGPGDPGYSDLLTGAARVGVRVTVASNPVALIPAEVAVAELGVDLVVRPFGLVEQMR